MVGKTTIDLAKAINQRKLIIFDLSKGKLGERTSKIYGRFLLTTLLNITLARAEVPEEQRVPVHFYVDEFHNYISDTVQEVFAEGRKYKAYLTVVTQVIGQGMSDEMRRNILGNVNVKIIGKAGYESREMMVKQMGFNAEEERILKNRQSLLPAFFRERPLTLRAFKKMKLGSFIIQVDNFTPRVVKNPKRLIGERRSMSEDQREKFVAEQLEKYYDKPFIYSPPQNNPIEAYNPFEKSSKNQSVRKEKNKLRNKEQRADKRSFRNNLVE